MAVNVITGGTNFIATVWFARKLGPGVIGEFAAVLTALYLGVGLISPGFDQALIRFHGRNDISAAAVNATHVQAGVLLAGAAMAFGFLLVSGHGMPAKEILIGSGLLLSVLVTLYGNLAAGPLAAHMEYRYLSTARLISTLVATFTGVAVVSSGGGVYGMVLRDLGSSVVYCSIILSRSNLDWKGVATHEGYRELKAFCGPLWSLNTLERVVLRVDYALVGIFFGKDGLGTYYAVRSIIEGVLGFIIQPIQTVIFAYQCNQSRFGKYVDQINIHFIKLYWGTVLAMVLLSYWVAPNIMHIMLGKKYVDGFQLVPGLLIYAGSIIWFEYIKALSMAWGFQRFAIRARAFHLVSYVVFAVLFANFHRLTLMSIATGLSALILALSVSYGIIINNKINKI